MRIDESINDKNTLKAIFLAGGPGSGKSFVASGMFGLDKNNISFMGVKVVNIDIPLEKGLKKHNLSSNMRMDNEELYKAQMEVREWARNITKKEKAYYLNSLLPVIIDGTGKNYEKITKQADILRRIGYDVSMVFVNTSLETALARNESRPRKVDPSIVEKMWRAVQTNIGKFQKYFGQENFIIIDNNESFEAGSVEASNFAKELYTAGSSLLNKPLRNPIGRANLKMLKSIGGKYLSDLPAKPLYEKTYSYVNRGKK